MSRLITLLVGLMLAALLAPMAAQSREYIVYSCKLPDGRPAPTDGWRATGSAFYEWFSDGCASGGPLAAGMAGDRQAANAAAINWSFDSGPATIRGYAISRSGRISGGGYGASMYLTTADAADANSNGHITDNCTFYTGCVALGGMLVREVPRIPEGATRWTFSIGCGGSAGAVCLPVGAPDFGHIAIDSARFRLDDPEQPQIESTGGTLEAVATGGAAIDITAVDAVSGVAEAVIEAGDAVIATARAGGDRCRPLGLAAGTHDYNYRRPCPQRWRFTLQPAVGALPVGSHTLRARVFDAAGNIVTALPPARVTVGALSASGVSETRVVLDGPSRVKARLGRRVRFTGKVESGSGTGLGGVALTAFLRSDAAQRRVVRRRLVTDPTGRFALALRATASRRVEISTATAPPATATLAVTAPVDLHAEHRRVAPLGLMRLTGRIRGETARRGASVAIKVRSGRSWRTIGVARADRHGRFTFSYRFRRTRHGSFAFRAVALRSSDLTVTPLPSRPLRIRVG